MQYEQQTKFADTSQRAAAINYRLSDNCARCDNCVRDYQRSRIVCRVDPRVVISTSAVCDMFVRDEELADEIP
jgi:hypothetical protein